MAKTYRVVSRLKVWIPATYLVTYVVDMRTFHWCTLYYPSDGLKVQQLPQNNPRKNTFVYKSSLTTAYANIIKYGTWRVFFGDTNVDTYA